MHQTDISTRIAMAVVDADWGALLILIGIPGIAFLVGKWLGGFFAKNAEFAAIKANFDDMKTQLSETTNLAKGIEIRLSHRDWTMREYKTLRRTKLEELMTSVYLTERWLELHITVAISSLSEEPPESPINNVLMLSNLYFEELVECSRQLHRTYGALKIMVLNHRSQLLEAKLKADQARETWAMAVRTPGGITIWGTEAELSQRLEEAQEALLALALELNNARLPMMNEAWTHVATFTHTATQLMREVTLIPDE